MKTGKGKIDTITENGRDILQGEHSLADETDVAIVDFSSEVETLRSDLASERDTRLRLAAEYDNYRRRTKLESARAADEGKRELLEQMLLIADELDLAVANLSDEPGWVADWVHTIRRRFQAILEVTGVEAVESVGQKFDPERHEAFDTRTGSEYEPGTVHTELRRGYFWKGKLLRPALVIVAK
jgi:molecular chaperone GrpE